MVQYSSGPSSYEPFCDSFNYGHMTPLGVDLTHSVYLPILLCGMHLHVALHSLAHNAYLPSLLCGMWYAPACGLTLTCTLCVST